MFLSTRTHSPADTVVFQDNDFLFTVEYCRPYKKGRLIFGKDPEKALVPYGQYWRTGANDATEIEFNKDITITGDSLKAGRYRFYTIPDEEEWILVFNSELDEWGYYEPDSSMDILRIPVKPVKTDTICEQFLITAEPLGPNQLEVNLNWDMTSVPFLISY
jgi:hypothetical protein